MKIETDSKKPFQFVHDYVELLSVEENGDIKLRGKVIATDKDMAYKMMLYAKPIKDYIDSFESLKNF